jgi:hypothetical protein
MNRYWALACMVVAFAACDKKEPPIGADAAKPSPAAAATPAPSVTAAALPAVDIDTLAVEEDFEADAEKDLTLANLSAKLDDLDKEISAP